MRSSDVNLATSCSKSDLAGSLKSSFVTISKSYRKYILIKMFNHIKCITMPF